ncbi:DNA-binding response regulator [Marinilabiliaceae bacterium JC017]|nr:DNA-binding response regulator [Marinilabiliaceae bacterium JC017]
MSIEFYTDPFGEDIIISEGGAHRTFSERETELIREMYAEIEIRYPEAFERLQNEYNQSTNFQYLVVKRFVKCNFGLADSQPDIDHDGNWHIEKVNCPLRGGFCKDEEIVCLPKENLGLTGRETEIMKMINLPAKEIANRLYISNSTVENHIASIKRKLALGTNTDLTKYALKHNLIK